MKATPTTKGQTPLGLLAIRGSIARCSGTELGDQVIERHPSHLDNPRLLSPAGQRQVAATGWRTRWGRMPSARPDRVRLNTSRYHLSTATDCHRICHQTPPPGPRQCSTDNGTDNGAATMTWAFRPAGAGQAALHASGRFVTKSVIETQSPACTGANAYRRQVRLTSGIRSAGTTTASLHAGWSQVRTLSLPTVKCRIGSGTHRTCLDLE
jgi:hypothetical protein